MATLAHVHAARMAAHAHGGPPEYDAVSIRELLKSAHQPHATPSEPVLRVFGASPWTKVTRPVQDALDRVVKALLWPSAASRAGKVLASTWDADAERHTLWFLFNGDHDPLRPLSVQEVEAVTEHWSRLNPPRATDFLVEVRRPAEAALTRVLDEFKKSVTLYADPAEVTATAHAGAVRIVPAAQTPTAPADPAAAGAVLREELLALDWPTSETVGRYNHSGANNPAQWAAAKRASGELLGVWSPRGRTYRHPGFQFPQGLLSKRVKALLTALNALPGFNDVDDAGGWRRAFWLYGAKAALAGKDGRPRTAAEVFPIDPERVIALARAEAEVDPNDHW